MPHFFTKQLSPAVLLVGITLLFWASAFAGIRVGLVGYSPGALVLLRFLVASGVLAVFAGITKMPFPAWRDLPWFVGTGFLGITVYQLALSFGEHQVTAGVASLIIAAVPVFTALLAAFTLQERLSWLSWGGIGISCSGVALIVFAHDGPVRPTWGALLVVVAAIAESGYFVLQKPLLRRYSGVTVATYSLWSATLCLLVFLPAALQQIPTAPMASTLAVVYLGVGPAAVAYVTWSLALARLPASTVTSALYGLPIGGVFIAWRWLGEIPTPMAIMGGVVTLGGVILVTHAAASAPDASSEVPVRQQQRG